MNIKKSACKISQIVVFSPFQPILFTNNFRNFDFLAGIAI